MTNKELETEILKRRHQADRGCRAWSTMFHLAFGISTITGVVVAAIAGKDTQFYGVKLSDYIPLIALSGSILAAVGVFGGFERKWKANRITRNELDILYLKIKAGDSPSKEIENYIDIVRTHDAAILNDTFKSERQPVATHPQDGLANPNGSRPNAGQISN
ncbi:hypothetical protein [Methylobacterium sp. E-045]|uniref:hypothetical protein n=1 Tax=Methylobacterium sp. E-045 TaxID=2836575 RepID=UPI001FB998FC|nr:hypothetical protein [Methylobacterium sp. E-045]MCJ2131307.1 hypothetical protein [Methylobacterium sp. E-045]